MVSPWSDMLALAPVGDTLRVAPGTVLEMPGTWMTSQPVRLTVRQVQPAMLTHPASCWAHCVDELGRPVRVYVTAPQEA